MGDNLQETDMLKKIDIKTIGLKVVNYIYRYLWLVLLLVALGASLMWYRAKISYVPYYQSSVTCTLNNDYGTYSDNNYLSTTKNLVSMFSYLTETSTFRDMLKDELGTDTINGTIGASVAETSNLLTITVTSRNPQDAYDVLIATLNCYPDIAEYVVGKVYFHIITPASVPSSPMNTPDYKSPAKKGAMAGGVFIIAVFALCALFDTRVNSKDDIEKRMNIKCLAVVPQVKLNKRKRVKDVPVTILNKNVGYAFKECYRTIRTRTKKFCNTNDAKVIMVTSAVQGEGKTTTAVNIALSLAETSDKVVLVDADLRKPTVIEKLNLDSDCTGIDLVLKGDASIEDAIVPVAGSKLMVLAGNTSIKNAPERMGSAEMKAIINELRQSYDYIIIDTPPCGLMADTAMISRYVDGAVLVAGCNKAKVNYVESAMKTILSNEVEIIGCVLNGRQEELSDIAYGYGSYKYGYNKYGKYYKYGGRYSGYGYGVKHSDEDEKEELK